MQTFDDLVPKTAANFRALCRGTTAGALAEAAAGGGAAPIDVSDGAVAESASTGRLHYSGCPVHRIVRGFVVQGGDIIKGDGSGAVSAVEADGAVFVDESFAVPHSRPGVLSMANMGKDTNGCQFFITLAAAPSLDKKHVAFGRVVRGLPVLRRLEALSIDEETEAPLERVLIASASEVGDESELQVLTEQLAVDEAEGVGGPLDLGGDALLHAAEAGDLRLMRELVERGVPVDAFGTVSFPAAALGHAGPSDVHTAELETSALGVAARTADLDMLAGLLGAKADPSLEDSSGRAPLLWATLVDSHQCVSLLLAAKANPTAKGPDGKAAAHIAAARGLAGPLEAMIDMSERKKDKKATDRLLSDEAQGLTPLHAAAAANEAGCCLLMLAAKASHEARAGGELSPLHLASAQGAGAAIRVLLAARADVGLTSVRSQKTALHFAAEHGRSAAAGALLAAGAKHDAVDSHGSTPLHWAAKAGDAVTVSELLKAKASPTAASRGLSTPLHLACEASAAEAAALLVEAGASVKVSDRNGLTPLHAACGVGGLECLELLMAKGADVNVPFKIEGTEVKFGRQESHTKTALVLAAERGHASVISALLARGANVNRLAVVETEHTSACTSALWAAKRAGHTEAARLLEAAGGDDFSDLEAKPGADPNEAANWVWPTEPTELTPSGGEAESRGVVV